MYTFSLQQVYYEGGIQKTLQYSVFFADILHVIHSVYISKTTHKV